MFPKFFILFYFFLLSFPAGSRCPGDIHWRLPKGPNIQDLQGTFKGLLGDQHKYWWFKEKSVFIDNSPCFTDSLPFFFEKQIYKSSKWGRLQDVYGTQLRDVPGTKWWDVLGTPTVRLSYLFFKFNSETCQTYFDRLLKIL